jgi:SGNH hydrolase-like domain, acetyltransferase AlgX
VLGDSFSHFVSPRLFGWQSLFAAGTGWKSVTYHINKVWLDDLLASEVFKTHPPQLVVLEFVERNIKPFVEKGRLAECGAEIHSEAVPAELASNVVEMAPLYRDAGLATMEEALSFLRQNLKKKNQVNRYQLSTDRLFSNRDADRILVLKDDQFKYALPEADLSRLGCYLRDMQQRVEANGKTRFVVMVAPDKTSAYCPYLAKSEHAQCAGVIDRLAVPGLHLLRLDRDIAAALERGDVDVYLPNDTHWGYIGAQLAAGAVKNWLQKTDSPVEYRDVSRSAQ